MAWEVPMIKLDEIPSAHRSMRGAGGGSKDELPRLGQVGRRLFGRIVGKQAEQGVPFLDGQRADNTLLRKRVVIDHAFYLLEVICSHHQEACPQRGAFHGT